MIHGQTVRVAILATATGLALGACVEADVEPKPDSQPTPTVGADASPPNEPFDIFGIRLAPIAWRFDDGTTHVRRARFYDLERQEECSVVAIEGKASRCLPDYVWNSKPGHFADSACSKPVVIVDNCANRPRYVRDESVSPWNTCSPASLFELRTLGGPLPISTVYAVNPLGNCAPKNGALGAANVALPIVDSVPLDKFVSVVAVEYGAN